MALTTLLPEFTAEMWSTRRLIERIPADRLDWRPHPKSFTARDLAGHLVDCIRWVEAILAHDSSISIRRRISRVSPRRSRRSLPTSTRT